MKDEDTVTITLTKKQYEWVIIQAECWIYEWCHMEDEKRQKRWEPQANIANAVRLIKPKEEGQ